LTRVVMDPGSRSAIASLGRDDTSLLVLYANWAAALPARSGEAFGAACT
jgi:hypothetical protein